MNDNQKKFPRGIEIVTSIIIEDEDNKILLVQSPKWHNEWTTPGGHVEVGEKIEEAALREAEEEVGLKLQSQGIISFSELISLKDFHRPTHMIHFDILCKTTDKNIKLDNTEFTDYVWASPEEALKMDLEKNHRKIIQDYLTSKTANS